MPTLGLLAQLACVWEATARKPGNVHRFRDFDDVTYLDFVLSAAAVAPVLERACRQRVGVTVLEAVRTTRRVVPSNTNLGMILLLAPLAAVPMDRDMRLGLNGVLAALDSQDARLVYEAIRLAQPSGLGRVPEQDVHEEPTQNLLQVMALAAGRDLVARQYANGFQEVFGDGLAALVHGLKVTRSLEGGILCCYLSLMAAHPDSLIARKRGLAEAEETSRRARQALDMGWPTHPAAEAALAEFDTWLRAEEHTRNPGTTADLVTACLFVALRESTIQLPPQFPWLAETDHAE